MIREPPRLLPLAAGVAVAEVVGPQARVKWPNDVLLERAKARGDPRRGAPQEGWAVLGIGLNVAVASADFPAELRERPARWGSTPSALEPTLERLLERLERWLDAPPETVLEALRERDALAGPAGPLGAGEGRAAGIDGEGRLVVETEAGTGRPRRGGGPPCRLVRSKR